MASGATHAASAPPAIAIVVVSYGAPAALRRCLAAVATAPEVVVVDNASPDGTAAMVAREFPAVRLLARPRNDGFSVAVNAGVACTRAPAVLLLNPDTELPSGGLAAMAAALAATPAAAILGFRQVDAAGNLQLSLGPRPTLAGEYVRRCVQRRLDRGAHGVGRLLDRLLRRPRRVPWVAGSALLVRRAAFAAAGGFDPAYFLYFEDIDFCLRVAAGGGHVVYHPGVTVLHHRGLSAATAPALARRAYRASQRRFWRQHGNAAAAWAMGLYADARAAAADARGVGPGARGR